jgi:hypothetical protein
MNKNLDADTLAAIDTALDEEDEILDPRYWAVRPWKDWLRSLRDEVLRLQSSITVEKFMRKDAGDRAETLAEENAKLRDVLRLCEWNGAAYRWNHLFNACPICARTEAEGHKKEDCKLAELLAWKSEPQCDYPRSVLRDMLAEIDEINGWRPTALSPGGVLYERARKAAGRE